MLPSAEAWRFLTMSSVESSEGLSHESDHGSKIEYPVAFTLHPLLFCGCFAGGMTLVLLAAMASASKAAGLDPLAALQYE